MMKNTQITTQNEQDTDLLVADGLQFHLVVWNDEINTFASGNVDQIPIDGLPGEDNIPVDYGTKTLEANGGEGNNTISSGARRSTTAGGAGNDPLVGR